MSSRNAATPPVPAAEAERLRELRSHAILDTAPEAAFDEVAFLAARLCGTPIALISLVDAERQWFKARLGLDVEETPRDVAFCAHAIAGHGMLEVPDALADARFRDNPLVTAEPKIRFYAGAPLLTTGGHALGTLCVIDRVPRRLDEQQRAALAVLSRHIVVCLELRRKTAELGQALESLGATEQALREKEAFAQATVDALSSNIAIVDASGAILATNRAWRDFAAANGALPAAVSQGVNYLAECEAAARRSSPEAAAFADGLRSVLGGGRSIFSLEYPCHSPDQRRWFLARVTPFAGRQPAVAVAHEDITPRRLAEEQLRGFNERLERQVAARTVELVHANRALAGEVEKRTAAQLTLAHSEAYHRTILDNSFDGIGIVDVTGVIRDSSPAIEGILGFPPSELNGRRALDLVHPDDVAAAADSLLRLATDPGETWQAELRFVHKQGSLRVVEARAVNLAHNPAVAGILVSFRDITARHRAEEAQRALTRRILSAQESERRRIALELHDEVGQVLTAVKIGLQGAARTVGDATVARRIDEALPGIDRALEDVRRLALDLRPSVLDDLGLAAALRWYAESQLRDAPLVAHVSIALQGRLPADLETACFRVVQEALTNVLRHARCRNVWLEARLADGIVELVVRDDGVGFEPEQEREPGRGLGLSGMEERVWLLGGTLAIRAAPGAGTEVRVRIPAAAKAVASGRESA